MSDERVEIFVHEFRQLPPEDQELLMALIARLRADAVAEYRPDVAFMDFDE